MEGALYKQYIHLEPSVLLYGSSKQQRRSGGASGLASRRGEFPLIVSLHRHLILSKGDGTNLKTSRVGCAT
jgi:hypothetical protein